MRVEGADSADDLALGARNWADETREIHGKISEEFRPRMGANGRKSEDDKFCLEVMR